MLSDSASLHTVSSSTPLVRASSKSSSLMSKLFRRSSSSSSSRLSASTKPARPAPSAEEIFREVMSLNARHGHPSVQALSVPVQASPARSPSRKQSSSRSTSEKTSTSSSPPQSPEEIFHEVMRLGARHGHPSVQALSAR